MKKFSKNLLKIFLLSLLLFIPKVAFADQIYNIDINVDIDENGIGHVSETWKTKEENKDATEKFKVISDLQEIKITDFKVSANGRDFDEKNPWDIDASFDQKAYKYGMIEEGDKVELCWGISQFGENTYNLSYNINPLVVGLNDYDMVYFRFIKENLEPSPDKISITVNGYEPFDEEVLMWGFGFEGDVHNKNGSIVAESSGDVNYGQLMLRFPKGTFDTSYKIDQDFDFYANMAQEGSDYGSNEDTYEDTSENNESVGKFFNPFMFFSFFPLVSLLISLGIFTVIVKNIAEYEGGKYKILNNKVLEKPSKFKDQYFREIPYDGNIEDTYLLATSAKGSDITFENYLNAFLLKWIYENAISFGEIEQTFLIFDNTKSYISINHQPKDMSPIEKDFFQMLETASEYTDDGKITQKHIEKYMRNNSSTSEKFFKEFNKQSLKNLEAGGYLTNDRKKKALAVFASEPYKNQIRVTNKGIDLYEKFFKFKNYLNDYSLISERDVNEVKLWDSFMIYAAIYGISKEVYENFTDIYPEYENLSVFDYYMISTINTYSSNISSAASNTLSSFEAGGGGGSSSFGGGGGGFGGGSGGAGGGSR